MQKIKKTLFFVIYTLIFTSCVSKKKIVYFQNDKTPTQEVKAYETVFKPGDILNISISSLDPVASKPFNLIQGSSETAKPVDYLIDNNGNIEFPLLGQIKLGGLTRSEALKYFKEKLDPDYIKNPTVNIRISNFTITVLGDVKSPGNYIIPNEKVTIIEAIGFAGDLNISGIRNIEVKREVDNKITTYSLDLKSDKIFSSPAYYLQQNDIVYIEPNKAKSQGASYNQNTGLFISVGSILISLITILTR
ncbi:Polysaccharide export outer membrane protein [Tenacibaculum sp. 190130A14a]|uniref:Polysaccharide biosynthesis/export protein n=1 Tax=Tenacibaculum polynesiense TaxID=3137857 RepID=A0ABP1EXF7_9FLAO